MKTVHLQPRLIAAWLLLLAILSALTIPQVHAAIYYVNAATGSDAWTGTHADPVKSPVPDGPWKTLAKVNATTLRAGDSVLLHCGHTWYESLTIANSGTDTNPINIGAFPSPCSTPPLISGTVPVPYYAWTLYKNNIYKTQLPLDLVQNSSFDINLNAWNNYSPNGDTTIASQPCTGLGSGRCLAITTRTSYGLASSYSFPVRASTNYMLSLAIKVPAGVKVQLLVRRNGSPWEAVGLSTTVSGTGDWQSLSLPFIANMSINDARVDFVVPAGQQDVLFDNVVLSERSTGISQVFADGVGMNPAHHPNAGFNSTLPDSVYLRMAADGNKLLQPDGTYGSTYIETGSDLVLPTGGALSSGLTVRVRSNPWTLDSRKIASVTGSRILLDSPTKFQARSGFGYFLLGGLWMVDSPGEWFYDAATKTLYVQMPGNRIPWSSVMIGRGSYGVSVNNQSNINISGLWIQGTDRGVSMIASTNIGLADTLVEKTWAEGVDAGGAIGATITDNTIRNTGGTGIAGWGGRNQTITGNAISESGVRVVNGVPKSLPVSAGAIAAGSAANVSHNTVQYSAYEGIRFGADGEVSDNWVDHTCMLLDDCGGIYTYEQSAASRIERNLVTNIRGTADGKATTDTHTVGIYLDNLSSNVAVASNSVVGADYGVQIHDGAYNTITGNTLYGNRQYQLLVQDDSTVLDPGGDVHDNTILANLFVPTSANPSVKQLRLTSGDASRFADYDQNVYSTLLSSIIVEEGLLTSVNSYTLPLWQKATVNGVPRNLDPLGRTVALKGFASYAISGSNLITNGNFTAGIGDWTPYRGQTFLYSNCPNGQCLQFTVNLDAAYGLIPSPRFSVKAGQYYRVSFDFKTGTGNQIFSSVVRRGGGGNNGWESLQGAFEPLLGTTNWQRHSYVFRSSKTINKDDPVTLDFGARLDFQGVLTGQTIFIDNVELVPVTAIGSPLKTNVLVNNTNTVAAMDCPDEVSAPAYCDQYVRFADATSIVWPHDVQPLSAEVIYSVDKTSLDSDGDGINNAQDLCPNTAPTMDANSKGCAINQ